MQPTPDPRWQAVVDRDARCDGQWFYAVSTTGVYCRPSCPARRPNPRNVMYFMTSHEAEQAGYRACRRCGPAVAQERRGRVLAVCQAIDASPKIPSLADLARDAGMSPSHLQRVFTAEIGVSPRQYALARRAERAREQLSAGAPVTDARITAGFGSNGRFYEMSDGMLGMTPTAWKAGGAGQTLHVAVGPCALGVVLVARTERGIAAILLGDDEASVRADLRERLPRASCVDAGPDGAAALARVVAQIGAPARPFELPLDVRGTAFQVRVWQALQQIPAGEIMSYAAIARAIDAPTSSRAVAAACAANPVAVVVPCHRVVRGDGDLAGYRWGLARKRALLDREAEPSG